MHYTDEDILAFTKGVAEKIGDLDEVQRFKAVKETLDGHEKVKQQINQIKQLQKQAVNLQAYGKTEAAKLVDQDIDKIQQQIDALPIVEEFKQTQVDVNAILQSLVTEINQQMSDEMDKNTPLDK
ncbi:MAG: RicAFT regulatory complex protein RicA family protein [Bacillota bacterium]